MARACWAALLAASTASAGELAFGGGVRDFPSYDNPISARAPVPRPGSACGRVTVMSGANLTGYGQVERAHYAPPPDCKGPWTQVVVDMFGEVAGVQFDRYGAMWFRGVELLRTTTPEPSPAGIMWHVEKDVSDYRSLFLEPGEVALQIPNVIDGTYTGVLKMTVTISFYGGGAADPGHVVRPLINVSEASVAPLDAVSTTGLRPQVHMMQVPANTTAARLDLYASGHGCEEFWYANELNGPECGGGAYRELQVLVNGKVVGAQYPFPVMYTGGVNPVLWRPLTGILSFDIPAYRFDLSPVLPMMIKGEVNLTVQVVGQTPHGTWFLDGVLLLGQSSVSKMVDGSVKFPRSQQQHTVSESTSGAVQSMSGTTMYLVRGSMTMSSGKTIQANTYGSLSTWSRNTFADGQQHTIGSWHSMLSSVYNKERSVVVSDFPFDLTDAGAQNATSFKLNASISFGRKVDYGFDVRNLKDPAVEPVVSLDHHMKTEAVYNRSTGAVRKVNKMSGAGTANFTLLPGGAAQPCYDRDLAAVDGSVTSDMMTDACTWAPGPYICGQELCGAFMASTMTAPTTAAVAHATRAWRSAQPAPGRAAAAPGGELPARFGPWARQATAEEERPIAERRLLAAPVLIV